MSCLLGETQMPNKREALQLLKKHFPQVSISEDDAVLLASPITTHGGLLEVRRAAFSKTLDKLEAALTATLKKAPYYAAKRFRAWDRELKEFRATPKLFGKQNQSHFEIKVILVFACRDIWLRKYKKEAPSTYRGDAHMFTKFVDDVIILHEKDFSSRSAIEAFNNYFFKM